VKWRVEVFRQSFSSFSEIPLKDFWEAPSKVIAPVQFPKTLWRFQYIEKKSQALPDTHISRKKAYHPKESLLYFFEEMQRNWWWEQWILMPKIKSWTSLKEVDYFFFNLYNLDNDVMRIICMNNVCDCVLWDNSLYTIGGVFFSFKKQDEHSLKKGRSSKTKIIIHVCSCAWGFLAFLTFLVVWLITYQFTHIQKFKFTFKHEKNTREMKKMKVSKNEKKIVWH